MKRWCVEYDAKGEVEKIYRGNQTFLGRMPSVVRRGRDDFYCDAVDEIGAMARYIEARKKKEQRDASMHSL